jgi:2-oxoglutarate/2-oxoacid ferredoxin oxidoreductase subunit alpha
MDVNILVGGAAGQGMDTIMYMTGKVLAREGYRIVSSKDYMSRVRGGHNFTRLRISGETPWTNVVATDILIALNEETYELHKDSLRDGGRVIYDPDEFTLSKEDERAIPVPLIELAKEAGSPIMANVVAVGALAALLGLDLALFESMVREIFSDKPDFIDGNITALAMGHKAATPHCIECFPLPEAMGKSLLYIDGNEVLGMSALGSGCRFMSAYPMTPSTGVMNYLAKKSAEHGVMVEQAEDEIAAINMALGASYAGVRAMTATSGGGFALMVEGVSLAGMTETPVVIVLGMRPGPATGLPTRTEQGDLFFALHGGHGEFPRAVLSATSHEDAFYRLNKAFELADEYQVPVIFLSDQNFADTQRTIAPFDFALLGYNRHLASAEDIERPYQRYRYASDGISPRLVPGSVEGEVVLLDSDEHDEKGNIIEDAATRLAMMDKRMGKLHGLAAAMEEPEHYGDSEAELLLIGWGSTYGVLRETVDRLRADGKSVALLHFADLWPLPQVTLSEALSVAKVSICVENNFTGQLRSMIQMSTGLMIDHSILKYDGRPFFASEIIEEVKKHA